MNVFVLPNTKEDILKNVGNQSSSGALTCIIFFSYYGKSMVPQNSLVTNWQTTNTEGEQMMTEFSFLGELSIHSITIHFQVFVRKTINAHA